MPKDIRADTPWAMTVAMATPSTPIPSHVTDIMSRTTFRMDENMRRYRGVLESPMALNMAARTLYINRKGIPRK